MMTTPAIKQIEQLVESVPGFTPIDQLYTLFSLSLATQGVPGGLLEIGSWCGRSTVALGLAARLTGNSRVCCVDLFPSVDDWTENADGSHSFKVVVDGKTYAANQEQTVWKEPWEKHYVDLYKRYPRIFDAFTETINRAQLSDLVDVRRGDSDVLGALPANSFRLAFLDGDHSYAAVAKDIRNVDRVLSPGGWICFDDAFSVYDGVNEAINEFIIGGTSFELCQQMTRKLFVARKKRV